MARGVPELGIPGLEHPAMVGRGGYGTVYAVDEPEFGRRVAVKVLHDRLDAASVRRAFVRECQAMGALTGHPNIVTVHRGGTTAHDEPYIVMDLMSGGSLADRMSREGPLPWPDVLDIAVTVAGALETAHRAGILHLDLKPANVLVSRYGEPKLSDFGISRLPGVAETTSDGRIRASTPYASPERLFEGVATPAADLYGLGATMFALLTGGPAFVTDGEDLLATIARISRDPVPDLRPNGVPDPVCRLVERLMAKAPADRCGSAAEAAAALQATQRALGQRVGRAVIEGAGGTVTAPAMPAVPGAVAGIASTTEPPTQVGPPIVHAPRRNRLLISLLAAVLVVGAGSVGLVQLLGQPGSAATGSPPPTTPGGVPAATTTAPAPATSDVVAVAPGVTHPATDEARKVIHQYVTGINESRYADALAVFHPDSEAARNGLDAWIDAHSTSRILTPTIQAVSDRAPEGLDVVVTFTSVQDPAKGPDGQACTRWELAYYLVGPAPGWLIRRAQPLAPLQAC